MKLIGLRQTQDQAIIDAVQVFHSPDSEGGGGPAPVPPTPQPTRGWGARARRATSSNLRHFGQTITLRHYSGEVTGIEDDLISALCRPDLTRLKTLDGTEWMTTSLTIEGGPIESAGLSLFSGSWTGQLQDELVAYSIVSPIVSSNPDGTLIKWNAQLAKIPLMNATQARRHHANALRDTVNTLLTFQQQVYTGLTGQETLDPADDVAVDLWGRIVVATPDRDGTIEDTDVIVDVSALEVTGGQVTSNTVVTLKAGDKLVYRGRQIPIRTTNAVETDGNIIRYDRLVAGTALG